MGTVGIARCAVGVGLVVGLAGPTQRQEAPGPAGGTAAEVRVLPVDGVINAITARYLRRGLREAEADGAVAVVLRLDTPGGVETAMREIIEELLASPVPVVVYVAPPGARAASAGMFVTIAAHLAAMAPGTNIGAAHPVGLGERTDPTMTAKLANDAAALARSIAGIRGRNAEWVERAVLYSESITAEEALRLRVIDLVAADLDELLRAVDGRTVVTTRGEVTLRTAGARVVERPVSFAARVLQVITDPNIAYILFTLGIIGLIAELYNPGMLFPGITGAISLVLAFVAFGSLPVSWAGVLLLLLGIGLLVGELMTEGTGILAVGGLIAFVLGSLMLYTPLTPTSPAMPEVRVSPWLVAVMAVAIAAFFGFIVRALIRVRREPVATGVEQLAGRRGEAVSDLAPLGSVRVDSEVWSAIAVDGPIAAGEAVEVVAVEGVTLRVRRT